MTTNGTKRRSPSHPDACLARGWWTTGGLATFLGLDDRSVSALIDGGTLVGHRPGIPRGDRRVETADLLDYCRQRGLRRQVAILSGEVLPAAVVCCGVPDGLAGELLDCLPAGWAVSRCPTLYHAGRTAAQVLVLGHSLGRWQLHELARHLREEPGSPALVGLASEDDGDLPGWTAAGFSRVVGLPCGAEEVARVVEAAQPGEGK